MEFLRMAGSLHLFPIKFNTQWEIFAYSSYRYIF